MTVKPLTKEQKLDIKKAELVSEIISEIYINSVTAEYAVFINYSAHVDSLRITVSKSREEYNDRLFTLEISVERSSLKEIREFHDTYVELLADPSKRIASSPYSYRGTTVEVPEESVPSEWQDAGDMEEANA